VWMTFLGTIVAVGCHRNAVQKKEPPDPLLITKKPVEGRPRPAESTSTVLSEPPPPPLPARDSYPMNAQQWASPGRPQLAGVDPAPDAGRR
jgi:hypothetical protein